MSQPTQQEIEAFVGRKSGYYLERWHDALEREGRAEGMNWAAFFLGGFWMAYRKMYRAAVIFWGLILLEGILEEVVFVAILGKEESPAGLDRIIGIAAAIIC